MAAKAKANGERRVRFRLAESIPYHFYRITEALVQEKRKSLKPFGITVSQWRILSTLSSQGASTVNDLSSYVVMQQPVVSRIVAEMEQAGLLVRSSHERDMRVVSVSLSETGERLFEGLMPTEAAHRSKVLAGFSSAEIDALTAMMEKIRSNLGIRKV